MGISVWLGRERRQKAQENAVEKDLTNQVMLSSSYTEQYECQQKGKLK